MTAMESTVDKCRMVDSFPEHVRRQIVEILKTGLVNKDYLYNDDLLCYLSVSSMSEKLKDACEEKLLKNTNLMNCLDVVEKANAFGLLRLKKEAILLIVENFSDLWQSDAFQYLSEHILETICKVEKVARHSDIFKALDFWLLYNHEARLIDYCKMLEIAQLKRSPYKRMNSRNKYTTYHAMLMSSASKSKQSVVTAVLNCDGELVCHRKLFSSTDLKDGFSAACVQKDESGAPYVFITSGKHVFRYDPLLNKEETNASLNHTRKKCSLIACGDCVYAIGGHKSGNMVREIEQLNTKQNNAKFLKKKWNDLCKIPDNISLCSAPCVVYNNKIYIIGEVLNGCQPSTAILTFTTEDTTVEIVAEFPKSFSDCRAIFQESNLYIASSEGHFLKFDINTSIFSSCSDLPMKSKNFCMYTEGHMIYVVCGTSSDNDVVARFEKNEFDTETNSWKHSSSLPCSLPIYGNCDIKVPSYTNVVPFYDTPFKEIR